MKDTTLHLDFVGYRVICKPWSAVKAIMSEFHQDSELLRAALKIGHGIDIDESIPGSDPMIYFVVDQQQKEKLSEYHIDNPTMLQLLGTSRCFGLTKEDAEEKFRKLMQE